MNYKDQYLKKHLYSNELMKSGGRSKRSIKPWILAAWLLSTTLGETSVMAADPIMNRPQQVSISQPRNGTKDVSQDFPYKLVKGTECAGGKCGMISGTEQYHSDVTCQNCYPESKMKDKKALETSQGNDTEAPSSGTGSAGGETPGGSGPGARGLLPADVDSQNNPSIAAPSGTDHVPPSPPPPPPPPPPGGSATSAPAIPPPPPHNMPLVGVQYPVRYEHEKTDVYHPPVYVEPAPVRYEHEKTDVYHPPVYVEPAPVRYEHEKTDVYHPPVYVEPAPVRYEHEKTDVYHPPVYVEPAPVRYEHEKTDAYLIHTPVYVEEAPDPVILTEIGDLFRQGAQDRRQVVLNGADDDADIEDSADDDGGSLQEEMRQRGTLTPITRPEVHISTLLKVVPFLGNEEGDSDKDEDSDSDSYWGEDNDADFIDAPDPKIIESDVGLDESLNDYLEDDWKSLKKDFEEDDKHKDSGESDSESDVDSPEDSQNQEYMVKKEVKKDTQEINTDDLVYCSGEDNEEGELFDGVSTDSRHPEDGSKDEEKPSENESEASSFTLVGSVLSNSRTLTPETLDDRQNDFDGENVDETNAQDTVDDFESGGSERVSDVNDDHQRESRTIDTPDSGDNGDSDNTGGNGDSDANDQSLTNDFDGYSESFGSAGDAAENTSGNGDRESLGANGDSDNGDSDSVDGGNESDSESDANDQSSSFESMFGDVAENTSTNDGDSPGATDVPCGPEGCLDSF